MSRIKTGWQLAKQSWHVVRADRTLLLFPIVGGIAALIVAGVLFAAGLGVFAATDNEYAAIPVAVLGLYALTVIGQFSAVALAACATRSLDGQPTSFADGMAAGRERLGVILAWSAVTLTVGALISAVESLLRDKLGDLAGSLLGGIANFAWSVATFFVVPVIALEHLGPIDAVKRSSHVIRERWGEGVVGAAGIGLAALVFGFLPAIALIVLGVTLIDGAAPLGGVLIAAGVLVGIAAMLLQTAISSVFRVALFRYATTGATTGEFSAQQLDGAFKPRGGLGRR